MLKSDGMLSESNSDLYRLSNITGEETTSIACMEAGIAEQTYYRWRAEFGELKADRIRHLDELQRENKKRNGSWLS
jgi:hypothetical protein